jgi:putative transposase
VIGEHLEDLEAVTSTKRACALLGASRATIYRHRRPPMARLSTPRPAPANKLTEAERQHILAVLRSEAYCDLAPAQVWARLLDDGIYLCSISTMYRLLAIAGEVHERRRQATHPPRVRPELVARHPLVVWSWDITKLKGPRRGEYYDLYVVLDIFSRYVVAWCVAPSESGELAKELINDAVARHQVPPGQLTVHADRGSSMTSNPVVELLAFLGIGRTHSRPHVSNDNPYSESQFKTLKRRSSRTTTTSTGTPASDTTRPRRSTTAPSTKYEPGVRSAWTPPTPPTPPGSGTAGRSRRSCRPSPGSTNPKTRHRKCDKNVSQNA